MWIDRLLVKQSDRPVLIPVIFTQGAHQGLDKDTPVFFILWSHGPNFGWGLGEIVRAR